MIKVVIVLVVGLLLNLGTFLVNSPVNICESSFADSVPAASCQADSVDKLGYPFTISETVDEKFQAASGTNFQISGFLTNQIFWMVVSMVLMGVFLFLRNVAGTVVLIAAAAAAAAVYLGLLTLG